jgi:hypothetical protein
MKAARLYRFGPPDVIEVEDIPRPSPASGEVLVRVTAVALPRGTRAFVRARAKLVRRRADARLKLVGRRGGSRAGRQSVQIFARADAHQILPTRFPLNNFSYNNLRPRVPLNDALHQGFRGHVTQL